MKQFTQIWYVKLNHFDNGPTDANLIGCPTQLKKDLEAKGYEVLSMVGFVLREKSNE